MTKLVALFIASLLMIQSLNIRFDDLLELDQLIEHARFHTQEYGDNFFVFISKHYGELKAEHSRQHQEERKDHERLPFQHLNHTVALSAFILNQSNTDTSDTEFSLPHNAPNFFYLDTYMSLEKEAPFQPPRLA